MLWVDACEALASKAIQILRDSGSFIFLAHLIINVRFSGFNKPQGRTLRSPDGAISGGQGANLLETRGRDVLSDRAIEVS